MAHEINNPLAYVANNLAVLERDVRSLVDAGRPTRRRWRPRTRSRPSGPPRWPGWPRRSTCRTSGTNLERIVASTREGVKRVADIVQNLRRFARLDRAAIDRVDLHDAITGSLEMIRGRLDRREIAVDLQFGDCPRCRAAPPQINQVFLNLLVNAMQALEARATATAGS